MGKSFINGMGTVIELFPVGEEIDFSAMLPKDSDEEAIRKDWLQVGNDLRQASININKK